MRDPVENAQLALLLEVAGTPKPGNVDRHREYPDLRFEHFLAGAVGARRGLAAAGDVGVGEAFERAVAGMADQTGGNTQFGALLLVVPLLRAALDDRLTPDDAHAIARDTTVEDACGFYRAFDHADVAVADPPTGSTLPDVRRGGAAAAALRERGTTLYDVMDGSADRDGVAAEWTRGFPRCFETAATLADEDGPITDRAARAFIEQLASEEDGFVRVQHDGETAAEVTRRARDVLAGEADPSALAEEFVEREINPGTTADVVAGGLFVALERGLEV